MAWLGYIALAALGLLVLLAAFVRLAPNDVSAVHVDPASVGGTSANSAYFGPPEAPVFPVTADALFAALDRAILATARTEKVAEGPGPHHASYITRSAVMGFPDYTSVRVLEAGGGATYAIYSRARFGSSDLGVNAARLAEWRGALAAEFGSP